MVSIGSAMLACFSMAVVNLGCLLALEHLLAQAVHHDPEVDVGRGREHQEDGQRRQGLEVVVQAGELRRVLLRIRNENSDILRHM